MCYWTTSQLARSTKSAHVLSEVSNGSQFADRFEAGPTCETHHTVRRIHPSTVTRKSVHGKTVKGRVSAGLLQARVLKSLMLSGRASIQSPSQQNAAMCSVHMRGRNFLSWPNLTDIYIPVTVYSDLQKSILGFY